MPTYHARSVTIRVKVAPLKPTITTKPSFNRGAAARTLHEDGLKSLGHGKVLPELPIPPKLSSSDHDSHDQTGYLNFLGPYHNVPFFLRCVTYPIISTQTCKSHGEEASATEGANPNQSTQTSPYAISVHITPSREGPNKETSFLPPPKSVGFKGHPDIMISVYLNGTLSNSTYVPFLGSIHPESLPRTFGGTRFTWLQERPWVMLTPTNISGRSSEDAELPDANDTSAEIRWDAISAALVQEAQRYGYNENGHIQPLRGYLESLAALPMPDAIKGLQKPKGLTFAVIDVALTYGRGRKAGQFPTKPIPLLDPDFSFATREAAIHSRRPTNAGVVSEASKTPESATSSSAASVTPPPRPPRVNYLHPNHAPQFIVPDLSKGSIVGFADPSQLADVTTGPVGIVRQIAPEMESTFVQSDMLLAVRYVVSTESL